MADPLLRITLGLSGMWLSWEASVTGLLVVRRKGAHFSVGVEQMRPGNHYQLVVSLTSCVLANSLVLGKQIK